MSKKDEQWDVHETWIAPSGKKSWSVFKKLKNGMTSKVGTYRSMKRAAEVELQYRHKP